MARFSDWPRIRLLGPRGDPIEVFLADRTTRRMLGLALLDRPPEGGVLIPRCTSVHTVGMRFPIDVAFVSWPASGQPRPAAQVLEVLSELVPFRLAGLTRGARAGPRSGTAALELAAGAAATLGIRPGEELPVA